MDTVDLGDTTIEVGGEVAKTIPLDDLVVVKTRPGQHHGMRLWAFLPDGTPQWRRDDSAWWVYIDDHGRLVQYHEFHMGGPELTLRLDPATGRRVEVVDAHAVDDPESYLDPAVSEDATPPYEWWTVGGEA